MLTRGIGLNDLVGERFTVGEVECEGVELCEPCNHLEGLTQPGVMRGLVHRAGLCAEVLRGGSIRVGDGVAPDSTGPLTCGGERSPQPPPRRRAPVRRRSTSSS